MLNVLTLVIFTLMIRQGFTWEPLEDHPISQKPVKTILITGYQKFGPYNYNPSEYVAEKLNGKCVETKEFHICWEGWKIPVVEEGSKKVANAIINQGISWDAIIHLGLENSSKGLKLETIAANVRATKHGNGTNSQVPCNKNGTNYEDIHDDGPCLLPTTVNLNLLNIPLHPQDNPNKLSWSRDAGTYFCNEIFYRTLYAVRLQLQSKGNLIPVIFIHLPAPTTNDVLNDTWEIERLGEILVQQ